MHRILLENISSEFILTSETVNISFYSMTIADFSVSIVCRREFYIRNRKVSVPLNHGGHLRITQNEKRHHAYRYLTILEKLCQDISERKFCFSKIILSRNQTPK